MAPKSKDFLESTSYGAGEFEDLQELFDRVIEEFAGLLLIPVGNSLRKDVSAEAAADWTERAKKLVDVMLAETPGAAAASGFDADARAVASDLRAALLDSVPASNEAIEEEAGSLSRELAELVLARWFDELTAVRKHNQAVSLNLQMLPGTKTVKDILVGVDFGAYGVNQSLVMQGLRNYRDLLLRRFVGHFKPIGFGTRLFVVPDFDDWNRSFFLYAARDLAEGAAAHARKSLTPISDHTDPFANIFGAVTVMLAGATVTKPNSRFVQAAYATCRSNVGLGNVRSPYWRANDGLMEAVALGVDTYSSGLAEGPEVAIKMLEKRKGEISAGLELCAQEVCLPMRSVVGVYAAAVAAGVEFYSANLRHTGYEVVNASELVARELAGSAPQAVRLVEDAFSGVAFGRIDLG